MGCFFWGQNFNIFLRFCLWLFFEGLSPTDFEGSMSCFGMMENIFWGNLSLNWKDFCLKGSKTNQFRWHFDSGSFYWKFEKKNGFLIKYSTHFSESFFNTNTNIIVCRDDWDSARKSFIRRKRIDFDYKEIEFWTFFRWISLGFKSISLIGWIFFKRGQDISLEF